MHSQLYLSGRLLNNPEINTTKRGHAWVKLLLETELVKSDGRGGLTQETIIVPLSCFGHPASTVKNLKAGDMLTVGCHLYGSRYQSEAGIKHGIQLVVDAVYISSNTSAQARQDDPVRDSLPL
jgi:single-stranded DNA-binding protein